MIKMDPTLPPGGLKRLFAQYDTIRSEGTPDVPPWQPQGVTSDVTPPESVNPEPPMPARPLGRPKMWAEGERDEKAVALMEERLRASHANKLLSDREKYGSGGVSYKQDEVGLEKAYGDKSTPGTYLDPSSHTLYVKGTVDAQDWYDDLTKVPAWGDLKDSRRYKDAERAYDYFTERGQPIDRLVGHSLGASVALELAKEKGIGSRTFGAPILDLNPFHRGSVDRVRHPLDPVSVLDRGAKWGPLRSYPHTYTGFEALDEPAPYIFDVNKAKPKQQSLRA